ncbi:DoxX family membrane protein [Streptomyces noursei]|uniref:DoxX family protein n=1 Tax=Streptomyces noursei TaxID=1971 RepID=UPI0033338196
MERATTPAAHATTTAASPAPPAVAPADLGLLLLRLPLGLLMAGHGSQKLFGLFGGHGLQATGKGFEALGYRPGALFAGIAGASELLGGLGLALGFLTPLAAAAVIGVMINAMVVSASHGLWATEGGLEYPMVIALLALAVALIGPGALAVDRFFPWRRGGWRAGALALVLGGVGAAIVLSL